MKNALLNAVTVFIMFSIWNINFAQAPDLGTASGFALFTASGAFDNVGPTNIIGDIGTDVGAITGFPLGTTTGQIYIADATSAQAAIDVDAAYTYLSGVISDSVISTTLGNNQILTPNVYSTGAASLLNGDLILDGQGDPDALFILKIDGILSTSTLSNVILINSASLTNVYWQINGAFNLNDNSVFRGTIISTGAINLFESASLFGRGLSRAGAISLNNNIVEMGVAPPVPVTLLSFTAKGCDSKKCVNLNWQTASEFNSDYFLIERSTDGINFKTVGEHKAAGYSSFLLSYFFEDKNPSPGTNYYRLNQFDFNGMHEYSAIKAAAVYYQVLVNIYPNPFTSSFDIVINNESIITQPELIIYNNLGSEVIRILILKQETTLKTSSLPAGIYSYKVVGDDEIIQTGRLVSR